jgi:hypothetical protein
VLFPFRQSFQRSGSGRLIRQNRIRPRQRRRRYDRQRTAPIHHAVNGRIRIERPA